MSKNYILLLACVMFANGMGASFSENLKALLQKASEIRFFGDQKKFAESLGSLDTLSKDTSLNQHERDFYRFNHLLDTIFDSELHQYIKKEVQDKKITEAEKIEWRAGRIPEQHAFSDLKSSSLKLFMTAALEQSFLEKQGEVLRERANGKYEPEEQTLKNIEGYLRWVRRIALPLDKSFDYILTDSSKPETQEKQLAKIKELFSSLSEYYSVLRTNLDTKKGEAKGQRASVFKEMWAYVRYMKSLVDIELRLLKAWREHQDQRAVVKAEIVGKLKQARAQAESRKDYFKKAILNQFDSVLKAVEALKEEDAVPRLGTPWDDLTFDEPTREEPKSLEQVSYQLQELSSM